VAGVQEFRSSGVQEFRSQEFRSQEFRSQEFRSQESGVRSQESGVRGQESGAGARGREVRETKIHGLNRVQNF